MEIELGPWKRKQPATSPTVPQSARTGRIVSSVLFALGILLLLAALTYAAYSKLNTWLMGQSHYLRSKGIASLSVPPMTSTPSVTPSPTPVPTFTSTPTPIPSPTPTLTPTPPPAPVQIRIPALGVTRSIVQLSQRRDPRTGLLTWNTNSLLRSGRTDLVGHSQSSAHPGQQGNMILMGHNYGYGYNAVFVRLGSLRRGDRIYIVNRAGQTFAYQVTSVTRLRWRFKDTGELTRHLSFLAISGPERVTLVTCGGANVEPFPERIYVVAEPVP